MGKMKDLLIDIQDMVEEGYSASEIAEALDVPIRWVREVEATYGTDYGGTGDDGL